MRTRVEENAEGKEKYSVATTAGAINVSTCSCPEIKNQRMDDAAISGGLQRQVYDRLPEFKTVTPLSVTCIELRNADRDSLRNILSPPGTVNIHCGP